VKVGDLVRWKHPAAASFGVVIKWMEYSDYWSSEAVFVIWLDGKNHGEYPVGHEYMELISESR
jgi:hypothetical protein